MRDDVCLTFDDGLKCQLDVALPILTHYKLTAYWFINTGILEGRCDPLEVYRHFRTHEFGDLEAFYAAFDAAVLASPLAPEARDTLIHFNPDNYLTDFPFYSRSDRRFRFLRDRVLGVAGYDAIMAHLMRMRRYDPLLHCPNLWLDASALRKLGSDGHILGLHSHSHPTQLALLSLENQRSEYEQNLAWLQPLSPRPIEAMSHPCNSYSPATLGVLRELGIAVGFRAVMRDPGCGLEFPREDHANIVREMRIE
jgi:peptidoglycan/xylan/chitin deacetylase (PgdA/CDA1 family)